MAFIDSFQNEMLLAIKAHSTKIF